MEIQYGYLYAFIAYLVVILLIGIWGFRKETLGSYVVADRQMSLPLAVGTFFATYISAATVLGFVGYATHYGSALFVTYYWGVGLGWITLLLLAARMRSLEMDTIPQLFGERFGSKFLRAIVAVFIIVSFIFSIMTQLVAGSVVLNTIIGIPTVLALILLAVVFTIYTVLGGMVSVVRTDFIQGTLLFIGVLYAAWAIWQRLGMDIFVVEPAHASWFAGPIRSEWDIVAFCLTFLGGVSAQPYYLHRFSACKDIYTARQMVGIGSLLSMVVYLAIAVVGLNVLKLVPGQVGDQAFPYFAFNVLGGVGGSVIMVAIICAIQSTLDSALHLAGVFASQDIYLQLRPTLSDKQRLRIARIFTAIFGVVCTIGALIFVLGIGGLIVQLVNIWVGTLASTLLIPLLAALFFPRATTLGTTFSAMGGFVAYFTASLLPVFNINVPAHPTFFGFGTSLVLMLLVSAVTKPVPAELIERFFPQRATYEAATATE